jgi:hypothetical protein|nr:MAG TPA_asm: hypothetical protein [Caudoviricetes sp.]
MNTSKKKSGTNTIKVPKDTQSIEILHSESKVIFR